MLWENGADSEDRQASIRILVVLLEVGVMLRDRAAAARLVPLLAPAAASAVCGTALTCVARHLGAAAALLGDREAAHAFYAQALEVCGRLRFRPELALRHKEVRRA